MRSESRLPGGGEPSQRWPAAHLSWTPRSPARRARACHPEWSAPDGRQAEPPRRGATQGHTPR
eukprot:2569928-Alexandrium_andersonii.AAC.1